MFSLNNAVTEMATYVESSGYRLEVSHGEETVKLIDEQNGKVAFLLENESAVAFIEESEDLAKEGKVDLHTAMLANAKQYVEVL